MRKSTKACLWTGLGILMCLTMFVVGSMETHAKAKKVELKVAFYPLEGFFEYDESGNETGYGVEVLDMISKYTGYHFTYVEADSWENTKKMLMDGEAQIRMPGTKPKQTSKDLEYTEHNIIDTYYAVMTLKNREDLYYEDYDAFANLKIGIVKYFYENSDLDETFKDIGINTDNLVFYDEYNESREDLETGKIDAVISNIMDLDNGMKQLERFNLVSNYISMKIGAPELQDINDALSKIKQNEPTFFSDLYKKWFPERAAIPFTKKELDYLSEEGTICFSFRDGQGYMSHKDENGTFVGFYPAVAQLICDKLGVTCLQTDLMGKDASGPIVYPDFYYDYIWADECETNITQPYRLINYYELTRKNVKIDKETCRVAAVQKFKVTRDFMENGYTQDQMVWCEDYESCIESLLAGKADIAYVNSYAAEYYLSMYRYSNISTALSEYSHQVCLGIYGDESGLLSSIMTKVLTTISSDELEALMIESTSQKPEQDLFIEWIYQAPVRSMLIVSAVVAMVVMLIAFFIFVNRMRKKNKALEQANSVRQEFLSRMSHDMRTPMNAIIGFSQFGKESNSLDETVDYHKKIYAAGQYLLQLINDSLDLSKLENGRYTLHLQPYNSSEFLQEINNILRAKAEEKQIHFSTENITNLQLDLLFDPIRVQQIFVNLLNNAIKFTKNGGNVSLTIAEELNDEETAMVEFCVKDDGIGMSQEFVDKHLFKPFEQERVNNEEPGTGLGLSIVKELVDAMGGTIRCESKINEGSTFIVRLKAPVIGQKRKEEKEKEKPLDEAVLEGKRILLCEDHPMNREIVIKLLEKEGMLVESAENGKIGVEMFAQSGEGYYAAILMDIRMPIMGGLEACRIIRKMERKDAEKIPIIALSANAFEEDVNICLEAGMNAHLSKPIDTDTLYKTLQEYV